MFKLLPIGALHPRRAPATEAIGTAPATGAVGTAPATGAAGTRDRGRGIGTRDRGPSSRHGPPPNGFQGQCRVSTQAQVSDTPWHAAVTIPGSPNYQGSCRQ